MTSSTARTASISMSPWKTTRAASLRRRPAVIFRCSLELGEVVADIAEDGRNLAAKEDHRDDNGNGDDGDDECVFDQTLAFVVAQECEHYFGPPFLSISCKPARLAVVRQLGRSYLRRLGYAQFCLLQTSQGPN